MNFFLGTKLLYKVRFCYFLGILLDFFLQNPVFCFVLFFVNFNFIEGGISFWYLPGVKVNFQHARKARFCTL